MRLFSVEDPEFAPYGAVLRGYDFSELLAALARKPVRDGIVYEASDPVLERCAGFDDLRDRGFGGLPIQIGCVSADNRTLNCLEYHKSSEFNIAYEDVIWCWAWCPRFGTGVLTRLIARRSGFRLGAALRCTEPRCTMRRFRCIRAGTASPASFRAEQTARHRLQHRIQMETVGYTGATNGLRRSRIPPTHAAVFLPG